MLTTEECPEMNVGTGKFSDDVEMTVEYSRSGPAGRTSVAGLGGAYRGGRPPTACLLRP